MEQVMIADYRRVNADGGSKREWLPVGTPVNIAAEANEFGYAKINVLATGKTGYFYASFLGFVEDQDPPVEPPPASSNPAWFKLTSPEGVEDYYDKRV